MSTRLLDLAKVESENLDLYKETFEWLASLTLEDDHEDGERFIKFVEGNLERDDPFRTFILIDDGQVM